MALSIEYLAQAAFKKLFGLAHTEVKPFPLGNEGNSSQITIVARDVYAETIPAVAAAVPGVVVACTNATNGQPDSYLTVAQDFVLAPDGTGEGHPYVITVPAGHALIGVINPLTGSAYAQGDRVMTIIPKKFGTTWRPVLYDGTKTEIGPLSSQDWIIDERGFIVIDTNSPAPAYLSCYVYIGLTLATTSGGSGVSGYSGFSGVGGPGTSGYSGFSGSGISGYSGFSGATGAGTSGYSGYSGEIGSTGLSGYSGVQGHSGYSGFSGDLGLSGYSGRSGYSGYSGSTADFVGRKLLANAQSVSTFVGFSGVSSYDVTTIMGAEIPVTSASTDEGVIIDIPKNYVNIRDYLNQNPIFDAAGNQYYGRMTYATGVWTLKTYVWHTGGEVLAPLDNSYTVQMMYGKRYNLNNAPEDFSRPINFSDDPGLIGASGWSGASGISGYSGYSGSIGVTGASGYSGYSGYSGISGHSGISGYSGYSGQNGTPYWDRVSNVLVPHTADDIVSYDSADWTGGNVIFVPLNRTGKTQTQLLNEAVQATTAGDTLVLAAGTYTVTADIVVDRGISIRGQGAATKITCSTFGVNVFYITASDARLADMMISNTGGNATCVNTFRGVSGVVLRNLFISSTGSGTKYGCYLAGSSSTDQIGSVTLIDVQVVVQSADQNVYGIYIYNGSGHVTPTEVNMLRVASKSTGILNSEAISIYNDGVNQPLVVYMWECNGFATASAGSQNYGIVLESSGLYSTIDVEAYYSTFSGPSADVSVINPNTLNLSNCALENDKESKTLGGIIHYMGTVVADAVRTSVLELAGKATQPVAPVVGNMKLFRQQGAIPGSLSQVAYKDSDGNTIIVSTNIE